jgi:hypothetical protein
MATDPKASVSRRPPRIADVVSPERDARSGRVTKFDRSRKNDQTHNAPLGATSPLLASMRARRRPRWLIPVAVGIALVATAGVVAAVSGSGDQSESSSEPSADSTDNSAAGGSANGVIPTTISTTSDVPLSAQTAPGIGLSGTVSYDATSTVGTWQWILVPDPFNGTTSPPPGVLTPTPGQVSRPTVELTGPCDGKGSCRLESRGGLFRQFVEGDLTPTGVGYRISRTATDVTDCTPVLTEYLEELVMSKTSTGWTGTSHWREVYSSHVDIEVDSDGGGSYTVCAGSDMTTTFELQQQ